MVKQKATQVQRTAKERQWNHKGQRHSVLTEEMSDRAVKRPMEGSQRPNTGSERPAKGNERSRKGSESAVSWQRPAGRHVARARGRRPLGDLLLAVPQQRDAPVRNPEVIRAIR